MEEEMGGDIKEYYRKRLLEEKQNLEKTIKQMDNEDKIGSMENYYSELSYRDNHPADLGTEVFIMEQERGLKNSTANTLAEIEDSLEKIGDNTFGLCNICGNEIDRERLDTIPYLKLCINCAEDKKISKKNNKKRLTGANLIESYNRSKKDIEFDDEDSYQAVARFNEIKDDPSSSTGDDLGIFDEDNEGVVEEVEKVSDEYYKKSID
ncbi:MAG TPA: TraR/DksA C4-type zinc finger protein [Tissierellales bacterium]|nr:TraR/DksA C4-type zinc finger protein [Tissierellales bacterium]